MYGLENGTCRLLQLQDISGNKIDKKFNELVKEVLNL